MIKKKWLVVWGVWLAIPIGVVLDAMIFGGDYRIYIYPCIVETLMFTIGVYVGSVMDD